MSGPTALIGPLLKKLRPDVTPHGFRATFKTWPSEKVETDFAVVEMCLAHEQKGVEKAHQRGGLLGKRRKLMELWADYCAKKPAQVIPLRTSA